MAAPELSEDLVVDLLRSAWIVERARARVYGRWAAADGRFEPSTRRASERAGIVGAALEGRTDEELVDDHAAWILSCVPDPQDPFAELFLARLGGWVDAHVPDFLPAAADRLAALGHEDAATVSWPPSPPPAPPYTPLPSAPVEGLDNARARIALLGDLHIGSADAEAMARAAVSDLNRSRADLVVCLGDVTESGDEREFERAAEVLAGLDAPVATIMGNHDAYSVTAGVMSGREHFERYLGRPPDGALLEHGDIRIALLDSVDHTLSPFPAYDLVTGGFIEERAGTIVRGSLTPGQHDILAEVAAPGSPPALVILHHPPQPFTGFPPVLFGLRDADSGRLHATCDSGNVWGVFAGHTHRNHRGRDMSGVPVQEVAAPGSFPFGHALLDVSADGYAFRFVQLSDRALLERGYARTASIQRRYAAGALHERGWTWRLPR